MFENILNITIFHQFALHVFKLTRQSPGPVFYILLGVSSDFAQPITGQVTEVTRHVIGSAQPELTLRKKQKMGPV